VYGLGSKVRAAEAVLSGLRDTSCPMTVISAVGVSFTVVAISCGVLGEDDEQAVTAKMVNVKITT